MRLQLISFMGHIVENTASVLNVVKVKCNVDTEPEEAKQGKEGQR